MFKLEDLSDVLDEVEKLFDDKEWFVGIGTTANRTILVIVEDPDDKYKISDLNQTITEDVKKLLDICQMKLHFIKVSSFDADTGELTFDGKVISCVDEDDMCDCGSCNCGSKKKMN